jgi:hypothetical protein
MTYMISATRKTMLDSKLFSPQCYFIFLLCCVKKKKNSKKPNLRIRVRESVTIHHSTISFVFGVFYRDI